MKKQSLVLCLSLGMQTLLFWGCDPGNKPGPAITESDANTCESCHTNETALKKYASESSAVASGGG